jgi:uncharacterized protein (TIGR00297 family)
VSASLRLVAGLFVALLIALVAYRARSLSRSGALTAVAVGTLAVAAGWTWGALLVAFFVASTLLSRWGAARKEARTAGIVEKGGTRDAAQVLANGGMFALAAALSLLVRPEWTGWPALGAGALAAATSDTWATEIGMLVGGIPRSLLTGRRVPPGTSGGITVAGTLGAMAGAAFIAACVVLLGWSHRVAFASLIAGVVGSTLDSVLGGTLQTRRWCDRCNRSTERTIHDCGATTRRAGGVSWLDNDVVNFLSAAGGGLLAMILAG